MIFSAVCGLLLIGAVLVQPGKGNLAAGMGGFGGQFGSVIGMRRAADFIMKATIVLAVVLMLMSILINKAFLPEAVSSADPRMKGKEAPAASSVPNLPKSNAPANAPAVQPQQNAPDSKPTQGK